MHSGIVKSQKYEWSKTRIARKLRQKATQAEEELWQILRNRKIDGFKFRRQQIIDGFIADFYCDELRLCIEVDGSVHDTKEQKALDIHRQKVFQLRGIKTIRFKNNEILKNVSGVLARIREHINLK